MNTNKPVSIALGVSLVLNLVFVVMLFIFSNRDPGSDVASSGDPVQGDPVTPAVTVLVVTATPGERDATTIAQIEEPFTPVAPTPPNTPSPTPASPAPPATAEPPQSPTSTPTAEPAATATEEPTGTPEPTATPTVPPTPTQVVLQGPGWLQYMNMFRLQAGLPPVVESPDLSEGSRQHSTYMVKTGQVSHQEDSGSPFYTLAGHRAGINGNLAIGYARAPEFDWAFNYWISAPFHGIPMLDPKLATVGFGTFRDVNAAVSLAATLDIKQGLSEGVNPSVSYPVLFPKDGGEAWVLRYSLPEFPDARVHCGYGNVSGAPIVAQIGAGDQVPDVTSSFIRQGSTNIEHCVFDETNYFNPSPGLQIAGRSILDQRDAIVLLPRNPLEVGKSYDVELNVNGTRISWRFDAVAAPSAP